MLNRKIRHKPFPPRLPFLPQHPSPVKQCTDVIRNAGTHEISHSATATHM